MENDDLEEDDDFTLYDDDDIDDSNTDGETILSHNPFSDENLILFSNRGLLPLKSVREVAARIQAFNQENIELAFSKDVIIQFLLGVSSEECLSILATSKSLRKASYSYEAMVRLLNLQRSTLDYLQEEAKDLNSYLNDIERSIFDIESDLVNFAEEDTIYISDHIKAQQALIQKHERDVANHPFTALAAIANYAMKKDNHTSTVLEKLLISARGTERNSNSSSSSSDFEEITAKEIGEVAKAAKQIERKQKGATLAQMHD